eukprot:scaffold9676_cov113-Isochrysis_galbana.AAC.2
MGGWLGAVALLQASLLLTSSHSRATPLDLPRRERGRACVATRHAWPLCPGALALKTLVHSRLQWAGCRAPGGILLPRLGAAARLDRGTALGSNLAYERVGHADALWPARGRGRRDAADWLAAHSMALRHCWVLSPAPALGLSGRTPPGCVGVAGWTCREAHGPEGAGGIPGIRQLGVAMLNGASGVSCTPPASVGEKMG